MLRKNVRWIVLTLTVISQISLNSAVSRAENENQNQAEARKVVLISIDGFRPDFYQSKDFEAPTLKKLAADGASADGVTSVFPTVTYPNHTALVTGVYTGKHGVLSNSLYDFEKGPQPAWYWEADKIKVPTLWQWVNKAGKTSSSVHWPVTVGADPTWLVPEIFPMKGYYEAKSVWELVEKMTDEKLMKEFADAGMKKFTNGKEEDIWSTDATVYLLKNKKPDLALLHVVEADHQQHSTGRDSKETKEAVKFVDEQIKKVVDAVDLKTTCVLIGGDHGFFNVSKTVHPNALLAKAGYITVDKDKNGKEVLKDFRAMAQSSGGQAAIYLKEADKEKAAKLAAEVIDLFKKNATEGYEVVDREELDKLGSYPDAIMAVSGLEGYTVSGAALSGDLISNKASLDGQHGFHPKNEKVRTGFIASGCGIKAGKNLGQIKIVDVAPTAAKLLDVKTSEVDGTVMDLF